MYSEDFNLAQELFLSSSKPVAALEVTYDYTSFVNHILT